MSITTKSNLACAGLLLSTILLGCGDSKTSAEHLTEAKVAFQNGKSNAAIISLKNILKIEKNNAEARFLLGIIYVKEGLWQNAQKELVRAAESGYKQDALYSSLAKVYYNLEDSASIEELFTQSEKFSKKAALKANVFLAMSYLKDNDLPRSDVTLTDLLAVNDNSEYYQLAQAVQYWSQANPEKALEIVIDIIANNPNFPEAFEYQAYFLNTLGKPLEASDSFSSYLDIHPGASQIRLRYMMSLADASKFMKAEEQADLLMVISSNNPLVNQVKAQGRLIEGDFEAAKEFSEIALKNKTDLIGATIIAGYSSYKLGQLEVAYGHLRRLKNNLSLQHPARRLLSAIALELGYLDEAYNEIEKASPAELDVDFLSLSSSQLFKKGDLVKASNLLDKAQELDPLNSQLSYQKGLLKIVNNDPESIHFLEQALKSNPDFEQAISLLVMEHLKSNRFDEALEVSRASAKSNFLLSKTLEGITYKMQGNFALAEDAFNEVLKEKPTNTLALFNLGNIAESNTDMEKAVELYQKVLMVDNSNAPTIKAIYRIGEDEKYSVLVDKYLVELAESKQYAEVESIILAGFHMRSNKMLEAKSVLAKSLKNNPKSFSLAIVEVKRLAFEREYETALKKLDELILLFPHSLQARMLKVAILNQNNKTSDAIQELERVVEMGIGSDRETLELVFLYLKNGNIEKASQLFSTVPNLSNASSQYNVIKGKVLLAQGQYSQAIRYLKPVFDAAPSAPILLDLVLALQKLNKVDDALTLISAFQKQFKLPIELMLKKAELYSINEPEKALKIYNRLAKETNEHYVMLNNIAYVYLRKNELSKAQQYSKRALEKAEKVPAVINTYGLILLEQGNIEESIEYLKKAYDIDINNHNYLVHYIQALFANKESKLVEKLLYKVDKEKLNNDSLIRLATVRTN